MNTKTRTALTAALALAVIGSGSSSALADAGAAERSSAVAIERTIGSGLKPATAKQKREIRRQMRHARQNGQAGKQARTTKSGARKQSRWYTPLGCMYFADATLCGSDTYFDVSYQIYWSSGAVSLGYMPHSYWNTLVYYYG